MHRGFTLLTEGVPVSFQIVNSVTVNIFETVDIEYYS
jgi:hypothetical protein